MSVSRSTFTARRSRWISGSTALAMVISLFTVIGPAGVPGVITAAAATEPVCVDSALPPPTYTVADPGETTVIQQDAGTVEVGPTAVD